MFELPEYVTIARQLAETVPGKQIKEGHLGNSPHKWVWYNRQPEEFASLTASKRLGKAYSKGRWLFIPTNPGYVLVLGECGGRILYHRAQSEMPGKYHLALIFKDGSALSATTQMWGAMELYEKGQEIKRKYICGMRPTPLETAFSLDYFGSLIDECVKAGARSVKGLLTQDQLIPGLGNSIAQDIMFRAKLHPKRSIEGLDKRNRKALYNSIRSTVQEVMDRGGRNDEYDLFGKTGGYVRILDKNSVGKPCPECGSAIEKIQYLGGACYFCPQCQI
jgi:formamidopyrimidine-DNA glycosylase